MKRTLILAGLMAWAAVLGFSIGWRLKPAQVPKPAPTCLVQSVDPSRRVTTTRECP